MQGHKSWTKYYNGDQTNNGMWRDIIICYKLKVRYDPFANHGRLFRKGQTCDLIRINSRHVARSRNMNFLFSYRFIEARIFWLMQWFRVFYFIILRILSELYDIIVRESFLSLGPCFSFIPLIAILTTFFSPLEPSSPSSRSEFWLWGPFWIQLDHPGPLELDQVNMCAHSTSVQSGRIMLDVVVKKQRDVRVGLDKKILNSFCSKQRKPPYN